MDVLENGAASEHAELFDIDWTPPDPALRGKVLVPVLGTPYGAALDEGAIRLEFEPEEGTIAVRYFEHRFPIDPREYPRVLDPAPAGLPTAAHRELRALLRRMRALAPRDDADPARVARRRRDAAALKRRLAREVAADPAVHAAVARAIAAFNVPTGRDALHALLEAQAFRLAFWRVAGDDINYRRFFDVNHLAGLRTERNAVFDATHDFVLGLAARGAIGGLRIDHPDGLFDPEAYFERLQAHYRELRAAAPDAAGDAGIYVVIEKIAAPHERLPGRWPVHGDTGYRFANAVNAVLVDPTARLRAERCWRAFVGDEARDFTAAAYAGKRAIMRGALAAGLVTLTGRALAIARDDRHTRDLTFSVLRQALAETIAWFPVYRTYVSRRGASAQDRRYIDWAVSRARRMTRAADPGVFDFVRALLLGEAPSAAGAAGAARYRDFAMHFQQYTAPVAAKGVEDTAFYTHTRLVSLNDVGGDPGEFGLTRRAFHRVLSEQARAWPHALLATSTHDNKRSEDVRSRIDVISERVAQWRLAVHRWRRLNRAHKREIDGLPAPSASDEYLLYQTLVGTFPPGEAAAETLAAYRERIRSYMIKAAREAKERTGWLAVDAPYEEALGGFVDALLDARADNAFLQSLREEARACAWFGLLNSLSMVLVKLTAPGVPDIYQGNEMLDYSLVDPDNRRPVDFAARRAALAAIRALAPGGRPGAGAARGLLDAPFDGRAKLWVTHRALEYRSRHPELLARGDYLALDARGARSRHVIAFARRRGEEAMIVVAGRLFASLGLAPSVPPVGEAAWQDAALDARWLPPGVLLTNELTGETVSSVDGEVPLAAVFASFPAALLALRTAPEIG
jgi:(1->4)-alpha-D-glucan 1-alpha-D-glucosylmutase